MSKVTIALYRVSIFRSPDFSHPSQRLPLPSSLMLSSPLLASLRFASLTQTTPSPPHLGIQLLRREILNPTPSLQTTTSIDPS